MGYNNQDALKFVLDIETAPLPDAAGYLEPAEAPGNYKDPAKIESYCAEKNAENLSRAALDLDLCRVVAVGYQREDWNEPVVLLAHMDDELLVLQELWHELGQHITVGYNTLGFDLPVLLRRSLYLGIQHQAVNVDKYRTNHIDLQMRLSFNGAFKFRPLSFYCKRFGIACEDETSGKDIGGFVAAGEWDKVAAHCRADVIKTRQLAERMGVLKTRIEQTEMVL